jgi:membrane-bound serine protease (ClpP class)
MSSIPVRNTVAWLVCVLVFALLSAAPARGQNTEGMFVVVPNPIESTAVKSIVAQVTKGIDPENPRRVTTVVFDFNADGKPASSANFGSCLDLQHFIQETVNKAGVNTVAFVHANTTGHTVLPVLACREIVMSKDAALGQIVGEAVTPFTENDSKKLIYEQTLRDANRSALGTIVRKMYDPGVKLRKGKSRKPPNDWVYFNAADPAQAAEVIGDPAKWPVVDGAPDGQVALYPARAALEMGLCKGTAESRPDVASIYNINPRIDPLRGEIADVYQWVLRGDIDGGTKDSLARVLRDVRNKGGNVLILTINVGGHDLVAARAVADELRAAQTGDQPVKVIAFITETAPAAGTVVALGCNEIVMYRGKPDDLGHVKEAEIGDFSQYLKKNTNRGDVETNLASIRDLAQSQDYPPILIDGMFKTDLEILRASRTTSANRKVLLTREQFDADNAAEKARAAQTGTSPDLWIQDKVIKTPGQLLKLNATLAAELRVASTVINEQDVAAVTTAYGWERAKDPDPGWLEKFAEFLRMPVVTVLIVVIGFTGLILELKVPGLTVPGIIAALSFILVFWAHSKFGGQTFVLAMLLFLLGLVLVGIEIFVLPGFGACGIFGILCMLAGLGLVTVDKVPQTGEEWGTLGIRVSRYLFAMMGAMGLAILIARYLPKLPGANRLMLNAPPETSTADNLPGGAEAAELLGAIGTANTTLRPAGVVKFGDKFVDVVSDGGFIPAGTRVQVIQVEGTRIVVKEV